MDYTMLQTISTFLVFIGPVLAGLGGFGQYYYSCKNIKKEKISAILVFIGVVFAVLGGVGQTYSGYKNDIIKDELRIENERLLTAKIDTLLKGNDELKEALKPFQELAHQRFPGEKVDTALYNLAKEFRRLEQEHKKTYFTGTNPIGVPQQDGSHIYKFKLTPVGHNIVPILTIQCETQNKTKITEFKVTGQTIPLISSTWSAEDMSAIRKEYRDMRPGEVMVEITTESHPGRLNISVDPFKSVE